MTRVFHVSDLHFGTHEDRDLERAMKTLLENGRNKMPAVGRGWSDRQLNALLAYVKRFAGTGSGG